MSRTIRDIQMLARNSEGVFLIDAEDTSKLEIVVSGPPDTPYSGGLFRIVMDVPNTFPMNPPEVTFQTKVFHPNVDFDGLVCIDILSTKWKAGATLLDVCVAIQGLLQNPNPDSPLNLTAANFLRTDPTMFRQTAQMWTSFFAGGSESNESLMEKINIITALGLSKETALMELTESAWEEQEVVTRLNL